MQIDKIPQYKRMLSYMYPVLLWKGSSAYNPKLELLLYHDQFQLATEDALYSDGNRYRPMLLAFNKLGKRLGKIKTVLVLGTGLGSAVEVLRSKDYYPEFTLVDMDDVILNLAKKVLPADTKATFVCADAIDFIYIHDRKYDMLIIDLFINRVVPPAVTTKAFLQKCYEHINEDGYLVLNYIINNNAAWTQLQEDISSIFKSYIVLEEDINRVLLIKA